MQMSSYSKPQLWNLAGCELPFEVGLVAEEKAFMVIKEGAIG